MLVANHELSLRTYYGILLFSKIIKTSFNLQWDEVMSSRAQLKEQRQAWSSAVTGITTHTHTHLVCVWWAWSIIVYSVWFMSDDQRQRMTRSPGLIRGCPHGPSSTTAGLVGANGAGPAIRPHTATTPRSAGTNMVCLNSSSPSESTSTACKSLHLFLRLCYNVGIVDGIRSFMKRMQIIVRLCDKSVIWELWSASFILSLPGPRPGSAWQQRERTA